MINYLGKTLDTLASSYWFLPGVLAACAFALAVFLTQSPDVHALELADGLWWVRLFEPNGARVLMGTIAGSMITVAGVTFSITISAIVHATSQFGPRLLINFMQDRGNQLTLGTFIATFLYCLVVLSSITGDPGPDGNGVFFIPHLAVLVGVGFAVASTIVLIYFVHHVPSSIHSSHVISSVGKQLVLNIRASYLTPEQADGASGEQLAGEAIAHDIGDLRTIRSPHTGYVQLLDADALCRIARELDGLVVLNAKPGDFVSFGDYLAWVQTSRELDDDTVERICACFLCGDRRTDIQDILFQANELVEIATRALSPGINDPFTAMLCIDWLGSAFAAIAGRHCSRYQLHDDRGDLRLLVPAVSASAFILETLGKLIPYVARDRNAALHMQAMLGRLMINAHCTAMLSELHVEATALCERASAYLDGDDVSEMRMRAGVLNRITDDHDTNAAVCREHHWLGGSN